MNTENIRSILDSKGNEISIFNGSRLFFVEGVDGVGQTLNAFISFPLSGANDYSDAPKTCLTLLYEGQFAPYYTDEMIADVVLGYCIAYAELYVRPVADLMSKLNTGKHFNKGKSHE